MTFDSKAIQARQITTLSLPNKHLARGRTVCNQRLEEAFISIRANIHESNQSRAFADPSSNTVGWDTVGRSKEPAAPAAQEQELPEINPLGKLVSRGWQLEALFEEANGSIILHMLATEDREPDHEHAGEVEKAPGSSILEYLDALVPRAHS